LINIPFLVLEFSFSLQPSTFNLQPKTIELNAIMCYTKKIIKMGSWKEADPMITAQIQVPANAIWFDGHFPDEPILPGVAQLSMVVDLIGDALGHHVTTAQVSRVRFKQAIRPAETMTVQITPKEDPLAFGFRISSGEDQVCSGNIKIAEKGD
jgi:3-hydroxyacyl-[acyl-carrier-protein] dehydratase